MDHSAFNFTAPELQRLRRLASDFVGQFIPVCRRDPGRFETIRLRGSRTKELQWLANEVQERLWTAGEGRVAVVVFGHGPWSSAGVYTIEVDYFLKD